MATEKRLIDANALLEKVQFRMEIDNKNAEIIAGCVNIARRLIENAPTVDAVEVVRGQWIPVTERLPDNFVSVLGYMTDAGPFPPVRECYNVGNGFFFPALEGIHSISHWMPLPEPPETAG